LVHGSNLRQKEQHRSKYQDARSREYLTEIRVRYDAWNTANSELIGPTSNPQDSDFDVVAHRVELLEEYKAFIDQQQYAETFDSRSNLHSSVLEEFLYYLFRDLVRDFGNRALVGKSHSFKDIFFVPPSYREMVTRPYAAVERKDHDFVIGITVEADLKTRAQSARLRATLEDQSDVEDNAEPLDENDTQVGTRGRLSDVAQIEPHLFDIPAVAIECKTYLDKTMLEGSSRAAEELKARVPNALYIVVSEWLKLTEDVNLRKYKVDQIYVFRRQKNTDREFRFRDTYVKNPIYADVVWHLYELVRLHLTSDWEGGIQYGLERGWLV
jgi:hypothetical protein